MAKGREINVVHVQLLLKAIRTGRPILLWAGVLTLALIKDCTGHCAADGNILRDDPVNDHTCDICIH